MFGADLAHKENNESYIKFLEAKINRDSDKKNGCAIKLVINLSDDVEIENDLTLVRSWKLTTSGIKEELEVFQNDILIQTYQKIGLSLFHQLSHHH